MLFKLYCWWYERKYSVPHPDIVWHYFHAKEWSKRSHDRYFKMTAMYLNNATLEEIAKEYDVTRERIRQILYKIVREGKKECE